MSNADDVGAHERRPWTLTTARPLRLARGLTSNAIVLPIVESNGKERLVFMDVETVGELIDNLQDALAKAKDSR